MAKLRVSGDTSGYVDIEASAIAGSVTATLPVANGTILAPATVLTNGVLLIGNTVSGGFDVTTLTQGTGVVITNNKGSITIALASGASNQAEIDFGSTPVTKSTFIITDSNVSVTSRINGSVAYEAPTGKSLDELEIDQIDLKFVAGNGQFTLLATSLSGLVADKYKINYFIG